MVDKEKDKELMEKLKFGMLLTFVGGFMDVYSYTVHGNVFATGQTGNFVLVAFHLMNKNYIEMFHALVPIISFWIGIFVGLHLFYSYFKERQLFWKRGILAAEILILFITGFIPQSFPHTIANSLVSLSASLQFCAFRKFGTADNYASIFCTGNMRSCAENYYKGLVRKDKQCLKKALQYSCILLSFFIGAAIGALNSSILHEKAIWSVSIVLSATLALSFIPNLDILKSSILVKKNINEHLQQ